MGGRGAVSPSPIPRVGHLSPRQRSTPKRGCLGSTSLHQDTPFSARYLALTRGGSDDGVWVRGKREQTGAAEQPADDRHEAAPHGRDRTPDTTGRSIPLAPPDSAQDSKRRRSLDRSYQDPRWEHRTTPTVPLGLFRRQHRHRRMQTGIHFR